VTPPSRLEAVFWKFGSSRGRLLQILGSGGDFCRFGAPGAIFADLGSGGRFLQFWAPGAIFANLGSGGDFCSPQGPDFLETGPRGRLERFRAQMFNVQCSTPLPGSRCTPPPTPPKKITFSSGGGEYCFFSDFLGGSPCHLSAGEGLNIEH
jgi:hypothetical protein